MGCSLSFLRHTYSLFKRCFTRRRSNVAPIYFEGPARRQYFDLPDPIMYYIAKNASSAIVYRKLVQSCKYFFIKRPLIVISCFHYTKDEFYTCLIDKKGTEKFDMEKIPTKMLWLTDKFVSNCNCDPVPYTYGSTVPWTLKRLNSKFSQIQSSGITLDYKTSTLEELVFFASRRAKSLCLRRCIVEYENGESVQLETIIAQFPLLMNFFHRCHPDESDVSTNTVKELLANPNFSKIKFFHLFEIPDTFDVDSFYTYLKSRDDFFCLLHFREDISAEYQERLEVIIDELLSTESTSFWFPCIRVPNLHPDTYIALRKRFEKDSERRNYKHTSFT